MLKDYPNDHTSAPPKNNPKTMTKKDLPFLESSNKNRLFFFILASLVWYF